MSSEETKENIGLFSNKLGFVVGFAALIIALYPLKSGAEAVRLSILGVTFSLYFATAVFLGLLVFSLYLYALNYIRYDFPIFFSMEKLRYLEVLANFSYSVAISFPLLVWVLWSLSYLAAAIPIPSSQLLVYSVLFLALYLEIYLLIGYFAEYKSEEEGLIEEYKRKSEEFSARATQLSSNDSKLKILGYHQAIIAALESILIRRLGKDVRNYNSTKLVLAALNSKIINAPDYALIMDLRGLRNIVAHNVEGFYPSDLSGLFKNAENLIAKLQKYIHRSKNN